MDITTMFRGHTRETLDYCLVATPISNRIVLYVILAHADSLWRIARVLQVPMDSVMMLGEDETDENPPPVRIPNLQAESVDEGAA